MSTGHYSTEVFTYKEICAKADEDQKYMSEAERCHRIEDVNPTFFEYLSSVMKDTDCVSIETDEEYGHTTNYTIIKKEV